MLRGGGLSDPVRAKISLKILLNSGFFALQIGRHGKQVVDADYDMPPDNGGMVQMKA